MANDSETVEQVCDEMKEVTGIKRFIDSHYCDYCGERIDGEGSALDEYSDRVLAAHKRELAAKDEEISELKAQVRIAKNAFFKIVQCAHSQVVHDIICEAEFKMNHPECREVIR